MGSELKVIGKSENIDVQTESTIFYIMKDAYENKKNFDYVTARCRESFGGSWIMIYFETMKSVEYDMSFAFTYLKWIKFTGGFAKYYLFQITEK